jgi:DGQHR domain-containing protein
MATSAKKTIKPPKPNNAQYPAIRFQQQGEAGRQLVVFSAPVSEILTWGTIEHLGEKTRGPQRETGDARVVAIKKFLSTNSKNVIPTAIVVAFSENAATFDSTQGKSTGQIKISSSPNDIASIVDGQHRLLGLKEFDSKTPVAVVGVLNANEVERAFQFLVINNKASRVRPQHTKALLAKMGKTDLLKRLKEAKVAFDAEGIKDVDLVNSDADSPFFKTIDWPTTPKDKRIIQATAIELSLDYMEGMKVPELLDRDVRRTVFLAIWKTIKQHWKESWQADSWLISKVGIICLTRFLIDRIASWADNPDLDIDLGDLDDIEAQTTKLIKKMDSRFWSAKWSEKASGGFDTRQGRDRVYNAIVQLYRNGTKDINWHSDIDIIDPSTAG